LLRNDAGNDHNTLQQQLVRCLLLLLQTDLHDVCCADEGKHQQNEQSNAGLFHIAMHALLRELDHLHQRPLTGGKSCSQYVCHAAFVGRRGDVGHSIAGSGFVQGDEARAGEQHVNAVFALRD
jgi:hypothetical protein